MEPAVLVNVIIIFYKVESLVFALLLISLETKNNFKISGYHYYFWKEYMMLFERSTMILHDLYFSIFLGSTGKC